MTTPEVNRRQFLRAACGAAAAVGVGGALASCSSTKQSGPVTLAWWDYFTAEHFQSGMRTLIADIEANVPGVRIQRRTIPFADLTTALTLGAVSGDLPDIAIVDNVSMNSLGGNGLLADLTEPVNSWGQAGAYYHGPWASCQVGGRTLGIPNNSNCLALYCNTAMLRAAGVKPPTTWSELTDAANRLTQADRFGLALSAIRTEEGVFQFLPFLWQAGGDLNSFATYGATALSFLDDLVTKGSLSGSCIGWTQQDVNSQFLAGHAAMQINGPWQLPTLRSAGVQWNVVALPSDLTSATCLGGENWVIMADSKHADKAWDVLRYSQQPSVLVPYLESFGDLPARSDLARAGTWASDPAPQLFLQQLALARPRLYGPHYADASLAIAEAEQAVLTGSASPTSAAAAAATKINTALGQQ